MNLQHLESGDGNIEYRLANGDPLIVKAGITLVVEDGQAHWLLKEYPQAFALVEGATEATDGN